MVNPNLREIEKAVLNNQHNSTKKLWAMQILASGNIDAEQALKDPLLKNFDGILYATTQKNRIINFSDQSRNILSPRNLLDLKGNEHTVVFNTESAWHFLTNKVYRDYVSDCHNIAIDGVGLKFALKLRGCRVERFHGPDLCQSLINNSGVSGDNILLVGGHQSNYTLVERKIADGFFPLPFY